MQKRLIDNGTVAERCPNMSLLADGTMKASHAINLSIQVLLIVKSQSLTTFRMVVCVWVRRPFLYGNRITRFKAFEDYCPHI